MDFTLLSPLDLVDLEVKSWNPEPGAKLYGLVVDRVDGVEGGFEPYTLLAVQTGPEEAVKVHCFHSVLRNEVERTNPRVGDEIAIKYLGTKATGKGSKFDTFEGYNVVVRTSAANAAADIAGVVKGTVQRFTPQGVSESQVRVTPPFDAGTPKAEVRDVENPYQS